MTKINYRHYICIAITLGFVACAVLLFPNAPGRVIESVRDFGLSAAYWFFESIGLKHEIIPTVTDMPVFPFFEQWGNAAPTTDLAESFDGFQSQWGAYWGKWASLPNFQRYLYSLLRGLYYFSQTILFILPFILAFVLLFKRYMKNENNNYNKDSMPLKVFKKVTKPYGSIKAWIIDLALFVKDNKRYWQLWLLLWAYSFNIITVIIEFFAFYMYFTCTFDFVSIYLQIRKLFIDLSVPFSFIPVWLWIIAGVAALVYFRRKIAYARLNQMEYNNRGFIQSLPVVVMVCGTMGTGKTTTLTDMALSQEIMFRDKAFELILESDLKFPDFPWINFELELKARIKRHTVYNLATCRRFVRSAEKRFYKYYSLSPRARTEWLNRCRRKGEQPPDYAFGYDFARYGLTYDDKLQVVSLFDVLEDYAQLYFILMVQTYLVSNYAVRTDNLLADNGNFPMWDTELFKRDSRLMNDYSRHAHIIDFDMLRLGKKLVEDNKQADFFEFGVVLITEVGKERGNQIENRGKKKTDETANTENDFTNKALKMIRHPAIVCNFVFCKVITDEQRPESWGADARDLCEVVKINEKSDNFLAMPFFAAGELLYSFISRHFERLYSQYRFNRGDNTLLMYLVKSVSGKIINYHKRTYNLFGYNRLDIRVESGAVDDKRIREFVYYLMFKKIYSNRFATNCYRGFYDEKILRSTVGINDIPEYAGVNATFDEMDGQKSYFFVDLKTNFIEGPENEQLRREELYLQRKESERVEEIERYVSALKGDALDKAIKQGKTVRESDKLIETIALHPELLPPVEPSER